MRAFKEGELDVLVATTVIEVGVDVPNATIMIVQEADRFGLAQLHQLRGRVGRGAEQSYCLLISRPKDELTDAAQARLEALVETTDGFELAERDLELRGEGQLLGTRQSGARRPALHAPPRRPRAARARPRARARARRRGRPVAGRSRRLLAAPTRPGRRCRESWPDGEAGAGADHRRQQQGPPDRRAEGARSTRPTSDFVREAAFNLIGPVDGADVIDLFAGSGALGLEALSRGARRAASSSTPTATPAGRSARTSSKLGLHGDRALPGRRPRARRRARQPTTSSSATRRTTSTRYERLAPHLARVSWRPDGAARLQTAAALEPELAGLAIRTSRKYGSARLTLFER